MIGKNSRKISCVDNFREFCVVKAWYNTAIFHFSGNGIQEEETMTTVEQLDALQHQAYRDPVLKKQLLDSAAAANPLQEFCRVARAAGYELYPMEVICAGEEFHAAMKRSTNGGGENSPKLSGQDDFYELFLAGLREKA